MIRPITVSEVIIDGASLYAEIFVGAEARYLRRYDGLGLDTFAGHAMFLGPTVYVRLSERWWVGAALECTACRAIGQ